MMFNGLSDGIEKDLDWEEMLRAETTVRDLDSCLSYLAVDMYDPFLTIPLLPYFERNSKEEFVWLKADDIGETVCMSSKCYKSEMGVTQPAGEVYE